MMTPALTDSWIAVVAFANPQQMDPDMRGMAGMRHGAMPVDAQGVGMVGAVDAAMVTITVQHEAIQTSGWPAVTMVFGPVSSGLREA
jgi:Cu/Ag efflux protein CusF